jgi:hypothetical protein
MMICCNKNKKLKYSSTARQAATKKNGLALKLQITKYKLQTNPKLQITNYKKMVVILEYLKCSLKEVFQDAV